MSHKSRLRQSILKFNSLLRPIDALFAASSSSSLPPPLFIIGPPRSGSTLTYQLVTQRFQVGYMTAPLAYAHGMINVLTRLSRPWLKRPLPVFESHYGNTPGLFAPSEHALYWFRWFPQDGELGHYLAPETIDSHAYGDLRQSLNSLASILGRPWVFKNLYLSISAGALARILPDARFLVVRRDPLLVCQSLLHVRERRPATDWWSVKPPFYHDWQDLPLWQQVARQVFYADVIPRRDLQTYAPQRYIELDYPFLCRQPWESLQNIEDWLRPLGYESHRDPSIPRAFQASEHIHLDGALAKLIQDELHLLKNKFDASKT